MVSLKSSRESTLKRGKWAFISTIWERLVRWGGKCVCNTGGKSLNQFNLRLIWPEHKYDPPTHYFLAVKLALLPLQNQGHSP